MSPGPRRGVLSALTIRKWVIVWAGAMFLAWLALVAGWLAARARLASISDLVMRDMRAISAAHELEAAILSERRSDLRWRATNQEEYRTLSREYVSEAERLLEGLGPFVTTADEQAIADRIRESLREFRRIVSSTDVTSLAEERALADELLGDMGRFQIQNERQMEESIDAAQAFGAGDFSVRAPVVRDDELGSLAGTFNNMASDIADREENRLHFVAMVAHDIKNPLQAIEMALWMLKETSPKDAAAFSRYTGAIEKELAKLKGIVRDLTDDIRVTTGHIVLRTGKMDRGAMIAEWASQEAETWPDHPIRAECEQGCVIVGDVARLARVVNNLVSNAVKYTPAGTPIEVRVTKRDASVLLSVADRGPGLSADDMKVIFQPFGRGRSADAVAEGSGLGLYAVKRIVEAHNGSIDVKSNPGEGTTFEIMLPLA